MLLILIYSAVVLFILRRFGAHLFRPDFFFTVLLFGSAVLYFEPAIVTTVPLPNSVALFVILSHFSFVAAFVFFHSLKPATPPAQLKANRDDPYFFLIIRAMTSIFVVIYLMDAVSSGTIPIVSKLSDLQAIRTQHWSTGTARSPVRTLYSAASHFAFIYVIVYFLADRIPGYSRTLALLAGVLLVDHSLSTGGRALIVMMFVSMNAVFTVSRHYTKRRALMLAGAGAVFVFLMGGVLYILRNPIFAAAPNVFLANSCAHSEFSEIGRALQPTVQALAMQMCYFHNPPFKLAVFLDATDWSWTYEMGAYNLSTFIKSEFQEIRGDIFSLYRSSGLGGNPWATSGRDFFIDFGFLFPMFSVLLGGAAGLISPKGAPNGMQSAAAFGVLACFGFWMPFMSPLLIRSVVYPLAILIVLPLLLSVLPRPVRLSGQERRSAL